MMTTAAVVHPPSTVAVSVEVSVEVAVVVAGDAVSGDADASGDMRWKQALDDARQLVDVRNTCATGSWANSQLPDSESYSTPQHNGTASRHRCRHCPLDGWGSVEVFAGSVSSAVRQHPVPTRSQFSVNGNGARVGAGVGDQEADPVVVWVVVLDEVSVVDREVVSVELKVATVDVTVDVIVLEPVDVSVLDPLVVRVVNVVVVAEVVKVDVRDVVRVDLPVVVSVDVCVDVAVVPVGDTLGDKLGADVVGSPEGQPVAGPMVGKRLGGPVGRSVGAPVGERVKGPAVGKDEVGAAEGDWLGWPVVGGVLGEAVGTEALGITEGRADGLAVGPAVIGTDVGTNVLGDGVVGLNVGVLVGEHVSWQHDRPQPTFMKCGTRQQRPSRAIWSHAVTGYRFVPVHEGEADGSAVGAAGAEDGTDVGVPDAGDIVGWTEGAPVGATLGPFALGPMEGTPVIGADDGIGVGGRVQIWEQQATRHFSCTTGATQQRSSRASRRQDESGQKLLPPQVGPDVGTPVG